MSAKLHFSNISRTRIKAEKAAFGRIALNALDHFEALFYLEIVFFFQQDLDPDRLRQSLGRALEAFPVLGGQLCKEPGGGLSVRDTGPGVLFTTCDCRAPMTEITDGLHVKHDLSRFIDRIDTLRLTKKNRPLATFRLTRLDGGGCALGIAGAHALTDGQGFYYFIDCWSRRHEGRSHAPALHDRDILYSGLPGGAPGASPPASLRECAGFRHVGWTGFLRLAARFHLKKQSVACSVLRFTPPQLSAIKNAASARGRVSLNDALSAHLWQVCAGVGEFRPDRKYKLLVPAAFRRQIAHPLSETYFGNAVAHIILTRSGRELADGDIAGLADGCRKARKSLDAGQLRDQMHWLKHQQQRRRITRVCAATNPYAGDLFLSSLYRFPIYDVRFDGQKPLLAAVPLIPVPWTLGLLPSPDDDGGIVVNAFVPRAAAQKLSLDKWQSELYQYGEKPVIDDQ